jgi:plasmid maintenance system antidote protein VapI
VALLLKSRIYASQVDLAGKMRVDDARVTAILSALAEHGGGMTTTALATKLGLPPSRIATIIQSGYINKRTSDEVAGEVMELVGRDSTPAG